MIRKPAVAGQFYPGSPEALRTFLDTAIQSKGERKKVFGVVSPHAGYVYSGKVAGAVFSRVQVPDTVLLLGPNHTGMGTRASIVSSGGWATPLGQVEIASDLAEALKGACPLLEEDSLAHAHEHSLEVQLPFLQVCNPNARIVPIAFMLRDLREMEEIGTEIGEVLSTWDDPVLVVTSSDMSHFESQERTEAKDKMAIERILELDPRGLLQTTQQHQISMCGVIPAAVMLFAGGVAGVKQAELIQYTTSAEASGDYSRVVGYAGMLLQ